MSSVHVKNLSVPVLLSFSRQRKSTRRNKWSPEINGVWRLKTFAYTSKPASPLFDPTVSREVKLFCKPRSTQSLQAIAGEVFALFSGVEFWSPIKSMLANKLCVQFCKKMVCAFQVSWTQLNYHSTTPHDWPDSK